MSGDRDIIHQILSQLRRIKAPNGKDLVAAGHIAHIEAGRPRVILSASPTEARLLESVAQEAESQLRREGFPEAQVIITAERQASSPSAKPPPQKAVMEKIPLSCRHIIAVGSGKGGVGKSTFAANLAVAAAQSGLTVGLLDADIYGPSQPQLFGITEKPGLNAEKKLLPVMAHGVGVLSIGMMLAPEKAVIWRGLMVQSAITQLVQDADWGGRDLLVIDLPPGTGDAAITLCQRLDLAGALIISTPQELALADVRRALAMFRRMDVSILGLVENMAYLQQGDQQIAIFGRGGGEKLAKDEGLDFLGALPLEAKIGVAAEAGKPIAIADPAHATATFFADLAEKIYARLQAGATRESLTK